MIIGRALAAALALVLLLGTAGCGRKPGEKLSEAQHERIAAMADAYGGEIRYGAPYAALDPAAASSAAVKRAAFDPRDAFSGLPRAEGHQQVFNSCGGCHSLGIVMAQQKNASGWSAILDLMVARRGMPPPEPKDRAAIIAYLSTHFGPEPQKAASTTH